MAGKGYSKKQEGLILLRLPKWRNHGWTLERCVQDLMCLAAFKGRSEWGVRDKVRRMFNLK